MQAVAELAARPQNIETLQNAGTRPPPCAAAGVSASRRRCGGRLAAGKGDRGRGRARGAARALCCFSSPPSPPPGWPLGFPGFSFFFPGGIPRPRGGRTGLGSPLRRGGKVTEARQLQARVVPLVRRVLSVFVLRSMSLAVIS